MAEDRTNMVSLLDIGTWLGGASEKIVELGDGFNELAEDWGPDVQSTQYINKKAKSSSLKGYEFSMSAEREYISDEVQKAFDKSLKEFPTGKKAETYYYRFFKTDISNGSGDCIRVPVIVAPSSAGGSGGDVLTTGISISGNGDVENGTITISETGFSWTKSAQTE